MKIIDLLNKIANEEEVPKKIKYNNETFTIRKEKDDYTSQNHWFTDRFSLLDLNEEVEVINGDKKIEKLDTWFSLEKDCENDNIQYANHNFRTYYDKINEIIDKVNKGE